MIISQAEEMNPLRRCTMEDCCVSYGPEFFQGDSPKQMARSSLSADDCWHLFGVYDGHGGRDIVDFLEENLAENIAQELRATDDAPILQRIERSFLLTDIQSYQEGLMASGATVVTCLVREHSRHNRRSPRRATIYTANCGDARSVLYSNGRVTRLSRDHKADDPEEIARIEKTGGFVLKGRVLGILAVARALGDHGLKDYVSARPHLSEIEVDLKQRDCGHTDDATFLILACDGVWDVVSDEEAVQICAECIDTVGPPPPREQTYLTAGTPKHEGESHICISSKKQNAAQVLVDEAMKRGSSDNISVIVAWF